MKLYKISDYDISVQTIEATRYNEQSYWDLDRRGKERRNGRFTNYVSVYTSFDEAKEAIIARLESKISRLKESLKDAENHLIIAKNLKP